MHEIFFDFIPPRSSNSEGLFRYFLSARRGTGTPTINTFVEEGPTEEATRESE